MNNKYDITERERKTSKKYNSRDRSYITTHKIINKDDLDKWYKNNNQKKGGKSRHYNKNKKVDF